MEKSESKQIKQPSYSFDKDFSDFKGAVRKDTVNLKLDIIKQMGQGFSNAEIVQSLSEKYHISTRDIYYHLSTLDKWTRYFLTAQESRQAYLSNLIRLDYIYREFSFIYQHAKDDNARLGALKGMLFTIKEKAELTNVTVDKSADEIKLSWQGEPTPELLKRYDEIIKLSRDVGEGAINITAPWKNKCVIEVVDPDDIQNKEGESTLK